MEIDKKIVGNFGYLLGKKIRLDYEDLKPLRLRDFADRGIEARTNPLSIFLESEKLSVIPATCKVDIHLPNGYFDNAAITFNMKSKEIAIVWGFRRQWVVGAGKSTRSQATALCEKNLRAIYRGLAEKYEATPLIGRKEANGRMIGLTGSNRAIFGTSIPIRNPLGYTIVSTMFYCDKSLVAGIRPSFERYIDEKKREEARQKKTREALGPIRILTGLMRVLWPSRLSRAFG